MSQGRTPEAALLAELRRRGDGGTPPTRQRINLHAAYSVSEYRDCFGSWHDALRAAGFDPTAPRDEPTDEQLLAELRYLARDGDRPDRQAVIRRGAYPTAVYEDRFGSLTAAFDMAELVLELSLPSDPTDVQGRSSDVISTLDLLLELRRLAKDGTPPTGREMNESGAYSVTAYTRRFGSWSAAFDAAGFDDWSSSRRISDEELLADLQRLTDEGHPPTSTAVNEHGTYSVGIYYQRFASWDDVVAAAGLESNRQTGESSGSES